VFTFAINLLRLWAMGNGGQEAKPQNPVLRIVCHPVTGFIVGIVGIVLAVYFYFAGVSKPNLTLLLHPIRTPIVRAGGLSELSVSLRGKPIAGNLTAAQFVIWNAGKAPIRHADILRPLVLMTASNCPIYEATIRSVSRPVIAFQLVTNEIASGRLGFDWKILEYNDAASIQVLYGGDQELGFSEVGVMVGQNSVPFQYLNTKRTSRGATLFAAVGCLTLSGFFLFGLTRQIDVLVRARASRRVRPIVLNSFYVFMFVAFAILFFAGAVYILTKTDHPQF
jgi:hypothetical protein